MTLNLKEKLHQFHEQQAITTIDGDCNELETITYSELIDRSLKISQTFVEKENQHPYLLLFPPGIEFITHFLACLFSGITAVPLPCLYEHNMSVIGPYLKAVYQDIGSFSLIGSEDQLKLLNEWKKNAPLYKSEKKYVANNDSIAMILYSSGSTASPKGVMITFDNLDYTLKNTRAVWNYHSDSTTVTWAPHWHIYGLVCGVLLPLYAGSHLYLHSIDNFIKNPMSWINAIGKYRATYSGGSNFGYELCVKHFHPENLFKNLDLSAWMCAVNGGETVKKHTLESFKKRFLNYGFSSQAFCPAYGMSEISGAITSRDFNEGHRIIYIDRRKSNDTALVVTEDLTHQSIVSVGRPIPGTQVTVIDPNTEIELNELQIGEICISSPGLAIGYWNKIPLFHEKLMTKDLGFIYQGELFITGRTVDRIILHGQNYMATDIENKIQSLHNLDSSCFFSLNGDIDKLVLIQEVSSPEGIDQLEKLIRKTVSNLFGLHINEIVFTEVGTIPKTSSGKLQRNRCREFYLQNKFNQLLSKQERPVTSSYSSNPLKETLISQLKSMFASLSEISIEEIDIHQDFSVYGFDSMEQLEFLGELNQTFSLDLNPFILTNYATTEKLAEFLINKYSEDIGDWYEKVIDEK